ncbi:MAG: asparagine synthase (glutamine-hydrolyzing), partial [Chitinivibrionales bacterium]|nr:asparagine synthase (glutamine-hydrolyzing) [Chitinivibrionales bacterium]MBD3394750.1 asparagine synthase (glutamine-hydrolyzing) [Chitinivibrionales bacterium]
MCGIAGCIGARDEQTIRRMLAAMEHRGPDDNGIHTAETAVLGHTRLSIVDVARGHQPLTGCCEGIALVCNGEIYNFQALRDGMNDAHHYRTDSDCETIVHLYEEYGPGSVERLDGMFAFALLDLRAGGGILLARDPIGIKPLYYGHRDGAFYFSSELGAMSLAGVDKVTEFPAGHYYTPATGFVRYYELPKGEKNPISSIEAAARMVRETCIASVEKRLLADPAIHVGSFCSGGLDSSLVAAIAAKRIPHLHTFVVGTRTAEGVESDDLQASREVAAHIGSTHHEKIITEDEYYRVLPEVIKHLESYDPSLVRCAVPCYFTCELAAK